MCSLRQFFSQGRQEDWNAQQLLRAWRSFSACHGASNHGQSTVSSLLEHLSDYDDALDKTMDSWIETMTKLSGMTKHEQQMLFVHLLDPSGNSYNMLFVLGVPMGKPPVTSQ